MPERSAGRDVHAARISAVLGLLLLLVAACAAAVYGIARVLDAPLAGSNAVQPVEIEQPQLQSAPQEDRAAYFARKEAQLHGYGWVDRERRIAHIPIDEAIRMMTSGAGASSVPGAGAKR